MRRVTDLAVSQTRNHGFDHGPAIEIHNHDLGPGRVLFQPRGRSFIAQLIPDHGGPVAFHHPDSIDEENVREALDTVEQAFCVLMAVRKRWAFALEAA